MIAATDRILVIAPHADDELIGVGGALLKWKEMGATIQVVLVACSDIRMVHTESTVQGSVRESEFKQACEALGDDDPIILFKNDSCLDMEPVSTLVGQLDKIAAAFEPTIFVYPEPSYHQDHQYVNRACTASLRPTKQQRPSLILTYEIPTSTWVGSGRVFTPNYYVDISSQLDNKLDLFENVYGSQFTENKRQKLASKGIRDHAVYRGMECGVDAAEAFRMMYAVH
jgi:LmbE family N-acetylglucosaminyl deacetylase